MEILSGRAGSLKMQSSMCEMKHLQKVSYFSEQVGFRQNVNISLM